MDKKTIAICAAGVLLMILAVWQRPDGTDDFRQFYRAASLAQAHESVYAHPSLSPATNREEGFLPFNRLPSYAIALRPLALLPFSTARRIWLAGMVLAFAACVWLFPLSRRSLALALALSFPVAFTFALGQDIGLILLITLAAGSIYAKGHELPAGLAASLLAIKLTYLPAVAVVFLAKSRRGSLGLALGVAVQLAISFAFEGLRWPLEYRTLLQKSVLAFEVRRMPNLRAVTSALSLPDAVWLVGAVILLGWLFLACRRLRFEQALIFALPLGLIASPYGFVYDSVVAIPLLASVADPDSWTGWPALAALSPLPYLMMTTQSPVLVPIGSSIVVFATLFSVVRYYRTRVPDFDMRITGSVSPLSSGTAISSSAS